MCLLGPLCLQIQSTLVISNSLISNNRFISKRNYGPCFNTEIYQQATKYCGKEEKLLFRSIFSSFPQYFQYISNLGLKLHIHSTKGGCSINCFPQFRKSGMSKYGYLEVKFEITRVDCTLVIFLLEYLNHIS